ncbi:hypothetical protein LUZ60_001736 [Juncus effusus]|nr:hypothetical protein LUZ60_001736 [Juncus effusus]
MAASSVLSSVARRLDGKVALITGGASGIEKAMAKLFAQHGARLVIADIQDDASSALRDELNMTSEAKYVHCDVTNESDVKKAVDTAVGCYSKLDIMFNNAGMIGSPAIQIIGSDKSNFEKVFLSVNTTGCYLETKHAARVMIPACRGSIISAASIASVEPRMTPISYTSSKHVVLGVIRSAAAELGKYGIRANCVSPYGLGTPLAAVTFGMGEKEVEEAMEEKTVLKGMRLTTDDIANATLFLGSDESKYVSGLNLLIDGAFSVTNPSHGFFN